MMLYIYTVMQAQIVTEEALETLDHVRLARRAKNAIIPVMFFGEYSYGWLPEKALKTWSQGLSQGCQWKKNSQMRRGVEEVKMFLETDFASQQAKKKREHDWIALPNWWCPAPVPVDSPWRSVEEMDKEWSSGLNRNGKNDICLPVDGAKLIVSERLKNRLIKEHGDSLFLGKNAFPDYVHIKQNAWTVARPKYVLLL